MVRILTLSAIVGGYFGALGYVALSEFFKTFGIDGQLASVGSYPMLISFGLQIASRPPTLIPVILAVGIYIAIIGYAMQATREILESFVHFKDRPYRDGPLHGWLNIVFNRQLAQLFSIWWKPVCISLFGVVFFASALYAEAVSREMTNDALSGRAIGFAAVSRVGTSITLEDTTTKRIDSLLHSKRRLSLVWDGDSDLVLTPKLAAFPPGVLSVPIIHIDKRTGQVYVNTLSFPRRAVEPPSAKDPFWFTFSTALLTIGSILFLAGTILAYAKTRNRVAEIVLKRSDGSIIPFRLPLRLAQRVYDTLLDRRRITLQQHSGPEVEEQVYELRDGDDLSISYRENEVSPRDVVRSITTLKRNA